jgi:hypothetical protein
MDIMGLLWAYYGLIMGLLWAYYGLIMGLLWAYYGLIIDYKLIIIKKLKLFYLT